MRKTILDILLVALATGLALAGCGNGEVDGGPDFEIGQDHPVDEAFEWSVSPSVLEFSGVVEPGDSAEKSVVVENIGEATLEVSQVTLDDPIGVFAKGGEWPQDVDIETGDSIEWTVRYDPEYVAGYQGALSFETNDPDDSFVEVEIATEAPDTNVSVSENSLSFGPVPKGVGRNKSIEVTNDGSDILQIAEILITDGQDDFEVHFVDSETGELVGDAPEQIAPDDEALEVVVEFIPADLDARHGRLSVFSNDPDWSQFEIPLSGEGTSPYNDEMEAQARVSPQGTEEWSDEVVVSALQEVQFDASDSQGPPLGEANYEWSLINQPTASGATLSNADTATPTLRPDALGDYVVELRLSDGEGRITRDPAILTVTAAADTDIHVELSWDTPSAPDQAGMGTDLDLHYLHPNGQWSTAPWGVYWNNASPEWDDGSHIHLNLDDLFGDHPEIITHDDPDDGHTYATGVYYFGDPEGFETTEATMRIFVDGSPVVDDVQTMEHAGVGLDPNTDRGDFWHVADIAVDDDITVDVVDAFFEDQGFPTAP